ncbi:MAG TPA: hypothetical protein QF753_19050 [Victivallales bacterium]|nr:hypothetical protein [Victivallales bacterium]
MFEDKRSRKVIILAHCILNQNAKLDRLVTSYSGTISEVANIIVNSGVGILQMPCPELLCLGLDRDCIKGTFPTIEAEKTRVGRKMSDFTFKEQCSNIADNIVYQIEEYTTNNFNILGIVGVNCSPTCGTETTWIDNDEVKGQGIYIQILEEKLKDKGLKVPIKGIKPDEINEAELIIRELLLNA